MNNHPFEPDSLTPQERRQKAVDYLLTLASRMSDSSQKRGLPVGFMVIVSEGDDRFTHHLADPDEEMNWMTLIGNIELTKHAIMNTNFTWEPVNHDGTELTEDELKEFYEEIGGEDED